MEPVADEGPTFLQCLAAFCGQWRETDPSHDLIEPAEQGGVVLVIKQKTFRDEQFDKSGNVCCLLRANEIHDRFDLERVP